MVAPATGAAARTRESVLRVLDGVLDPEVPVLSVVELVIVRDVEITPDAVTVVVTPTYSGCPAIKAIESDILAALRESGHGDARVRTSFSPAWTTDWIGDEAKAKLRAYGIAPPRRARPHAVPVLRLDANDPAQRVRLDGVQVDVLLRRLLPAVRGVQGHLTTITRRGRIPTDPATAASPSHDPRGSA